MNRAVLADAWIVEVVQGKILIMNPEQSLLHLLQRRKSGEHLAYGEQHQRDSVLTKPTLVINAVYVFKHSRKTSGKKQR